MSVVHGVEFKRAGRPKYKGEHPPLPWKIEFSIKNYNCNYCTGYTVL